MNQTTTWMLRLDFMQHFLTKFIRLSNSTIAVLILSEDCHREIKSYVTKKLGNCIDDTDEKLGLQATCPLV